MRSSSMKMASISYNYIYRVGLTLYVMKVLAYRLIIYIKMIKSQIF